MKYKKTIANIKVKKGSDFDDMSCMFLIKIKDQISLPVSMLGNMSHESEMVAKVMPIYKLKAINNVCNYWPISLLLLLSKVLEQVVHTRLDSLFGTHNLLYKGQYGLWNYHSTSRTLTHFVINKIKPRENNKHTLV